MAAARAQQAVVDVRSAAAVTEYDEFVDAAGTLRHVWRELAEVRRPAWSWRSLKTAHAVRSLSTTTASPTSRSTAGEAVTNGDGTGAGALELDALPLVIDGGGLGHAGIRPGQRSRLLDAVLPTLRAALGDQRGAAGAAAVRHPGYVGLPAASRCRAGISCSCTAATSAAPPTALSGERGLDAGAVGCGLCAG